MPPELLLQPTREPSSLFAPVRKAVGSSAEERASREAFQSFTQGLTEILQTAKPDRWWMQTYKYLRRAQNRLHEFDPAVRAYLENHLEQVLDVLRAQTETKDRDEPAVSAQEALHALADALGDPPVEHGEALELRSVPLKDILKVRDHFELEERQGEDGENLRILKVRATPHEAWSECILPSSERMWHKGGMPRVVLKILAGAPRDLIENELPPNDFDVVASGDEREARAEAAAIGVDPEGVELVDRLDFAHILRTRDMDLNQCLLGRDRLLFTTKALQASLTGEIELESEDRGIYGTEVMYYEGVRLAKNRGMFRLIKFVAEGKARAFAFTPLNKEVDFGLYWLVLARKFGRKPDAGQLLNRLYELGRQVGQVRPGELDIYDVLMRVHGDYPFFRFDDKPLDQAGIARWLGGKLAKLADKRFRREHRIGLDFELTRRPGDTVPSRVSLERYVDDPRRDEVIGKEWKAFVETCSRRTARMSKLPQ